MNELFRQELEKLDRDTIRWRAERIERVRRSIVEADGKSFVYFFRENGMGAVKIGVTGDTSRRLSNMQANTPHEIEFILRIRANKELEEHLHNVFAEDLIRGEWFRPSSALEGYIRGASRIAEGRVMTDEEISFLVPGSAVVAGSSEEQARTREALEARAAADLIEKSSTKNLINEALRRRNFLSSP